jgi:serine/threonine-protein kinase RsbW
VVGGACKLVDADNADQLANEVVSAFSEAFNNVVLHGYAGVPRGDIEVTLSHALVAPDTVELRVSMKDTGRTFDPGQHLELPDEMPERGMGLFIMRSFTDELLYEPGPPNVLTLVKRAKPGKKKSAPP